MKALTIANAQTIVLGLQDEIRRNDQARYDHRLHAILLVAQGVHCPEVARMLGDAVRTVEGWVRRFEEEGLSGLVDADRTGRPRRLNEGQLARVSQVLRDTPRDFGLVGNLWDGKTVSAFLSQEFGVELGARQCQRMFRQLGFRLRKPRPLIAKADPVLQEAEKKTAGHDE